MPPASTASLPDPAAGSRGAPRRVGPDQTAAGSRQLAPGSGRNRAGPGKAWIPGFRVAVLHRRFGPGKCGARCRAIPCREPGRTARAKARLDPGRPGKRFFGFPVSTTFPRQPGTARIPAQAHSVSGSLAPVANSRNPGVAVPYTWSHLLRERRPQRYTRPRPSPAGPRRGR